MNPKLYLIGMSVKNRNAAIVDLDLITVLETTKKIDFEIGLGGRYILNHFSLGEARFRTSTLRIDFTSGIFYSYNDKSSFGAGIRIGNNRDFYELNAYQKYNFRYDATLIYSYQLTKRLKLRGNLHFNLQKQLDPYLLNEPKTMILLGINYSFISNSK